MYGLKILIAGNGKLGETIAKQLSSEKHDITLVDSNQSVLDSALNRYDILAIHGNCASMDILRQADVEKADLLIAVTGSDEVNLLCCTTAHWLNPSIHTIARIRNPEYDEQAYSMRDAFALSMILNPEKQAATEIERLVKYPGFLKRETFAKGRMEIVELRVDSGSKLCNVTLSSLNSIVKCKVLVCAVLRNGQAVAPSGNFVLREGDRIFVTAPTDALSILLKNLGIITHKVRKVMLVGGGKMSFYLAQDLLKSHIDVTVLDKNPATCRDFADALPKATVICGDASNQQIFEDEGLSAFDALITLTGLDELNMIVSLYGSTCGVEQIITKLGKTDNTSILDKMQLGSVISPRKLCCNTIVRYVRAMHKQTGAAITVHSIADGQAEAMEFPVDEGTLNQDVPLKKIKLKDNILLVGVNRGANTEIPSGDTTFSKGDSVVIVSSNPTVITELNDIFA